VSAASAACDVEEAGAKVDRIIEMPHVVPATPNGCRRWDAATAGKRGQAKGTSVHYGCYEGEMYAGPNVVKIGDNYLQGFELG